MTALDDRREVVRVGEGRRRGDCRGDGRNGPGVPPVGRRPRVIESFGDLGGAQVYLLDERSGHYRRPPDAPGAQMYAASGDRFAADVAEIMSEQPLLSSIVDARTGVAVAALPGRAKPVGWYDDRTVLALAPGWRLALTLLFVDAQSGQTGRTLDLPGMIGVDDLQVGLVSEMSESARAYGL